MERLETSGCNDVIRWYKNVSNDHIFVKVRICMSYVKINWQVNMLEQDLLLTVINHGQCHWTLLVLTK